MAGRVQNLKPFPKGVSGNPGGRPKNDLAKQIAQAVFEQNEEAIYIAMTKALLKGNAYTFKELAERAFGKLTNRMEITDDAELLRRLAAGRKRVSEMTAKRTTTKSGNSNRG
jgi:hypothetical protein